MVIRFFFRFTEPIGEFTIFIYKSGNNFLCDTYVHLRNSAGKYSTKEQQFHSSFLLFFKFIARVFQQIYRILILITISSQQDDICSQHNNYSMITSEFLLFTRDVSSLASLSTSCLNESVRACACMP